MIKHRLTLTTTERTDLLAKVTKGKAAAKLIQKAQVLLATKELLVSEISAWQTKRNAKQVKANWQFTAKDARIKLYKLYPAT